LECTLDPFFLIGVRSGRDHVFFASRNARFYVVALFQGFPIFEIFNIHRIFFGAGEYAHVVLAIFVAAAASDARFCEVHYLKGVGFVFDAAFHSKVKPLLMTSSVRINLHEQVVRVFAETIPFRMEEISGFKK